MKHIMLDERVESELKRLESGKWHSSSLGGIDAVRALFADEFVTVQYIDPFGDIERIIGAKNVWASADERGVRVGKRLDAAHFDFGEWAFIELSKEVVLVSYRVTERSLGWSAYATSVWSRRGEAWKTVFYQATRAKGFETPPK